MTIKAIATDRIALCNAGAFLEAGDTYWADDVVSIEPMGPMSETPTPTAISSRPTFWPRCMLGRSSKACFISPMRSMWEYARRAGGGRPAQPGGKPAHVNDAVSARPRGPSGALRHLPTLRAGRMEKFTPQCARRPTQTRRRYRPDLTHQPQQAGAPPTHRA
jgi:hypothetical protein